MVAVALELEKGLITVVWVVDVKLVGDELVPDERRLFNELEVAVVAGPPELEIGFVPVVDVVVVRLNDGLVKLPDGVEAENMELEEGVTALPLAGALENDGDPVFVFVKLVGEEIEDGLALVFREVLVLGLVTALLDEVAEVDLLAVPTVFELTVRIELRLGVLIGSGEIAVVADPV